MTRLVQLDRDDDVAAIRGRLETTPDDVVVLIAPPGNKTLHNEVHVRLIRRHAEQLGKELAFVSRDGTVRRNAHEAGVRVFWTVRGVPVVSNHLPPPGPLTRLMGHMSGAAGWVATTMAFAGLAALALIVLPKADITIYPLTEPIDEAMAMTATTAVTFPSAGQLKIPARLIELKVEASGTSQGTGSRQAPDRKATGRVSITNRGEEPIQLPQGVKLTAEGGTEFTTNRTVTVPGGRGTVDVEITASESGTPGNLGVGSIRQFADGSLGSRLTVTNPGPTQGGTTSDGLAVTAEDRSTLRQKVLEQLRSDGAKAIAEKRGEDESIYPETISVRAQKETFSEAEPAAPGDRPGLLLKLEGVARALAFDGKTVNQTVMRHLSERTDGRYALLEESLRTRPLEAFHWNDEEVQFHLAVQATAMTRTDRSAVVQAITGRTPDEAADVLSKVLPMARPPLIELWPFWVNRVPRFSWRVGLNFVGANAAAQRAAAAPPIPR